ncbi:MAG: glycosyltransferase family 4 protein [Candidatus Thermoplasmatota archaeon]
MKISILCFDISNNCLGRAYMLSEMLCTKHDIEIIGPIFGDDVWLPLKNMGREKLRYKAIKSLGYPWFYSTIKKLVGSIDGDVVYASKPRPSSFGIGIIKKIIKDIPLVLDIDDNETCMDFKNMKEYFRNFFSLQDPNAYLYTCFIEKFFSIADEITVASDFLKNRFGGEYIPHARDTHILDPARYDRKKLRDAMGIGDDFIVLFYGTPRPHKGIEEIANAVLDLRKKKRHVMLMIVGGNEGIDKKILTELEKEGGLIIEGAKSFSEIPNYVSIADVVVLPQRLTAFSIAQVPAKLIDAMAMAKPIIGTKVSDIPKILDGCGIVVDITEEGKADSNALTKALEWVLDNEDDAKAMGAKAREKCTKNFSYDVVGKRLLNIFERFE